MEPFSIFRANTNPDQTLCSLTRDSRLTSLILCDTTPSCYFLIDGSQARLQALEHAVEGVSRIFSSRGHQTN